MSLIPQIANYQASVPLRQAAARILDSVMGASIAYSLRKVKSDYKGAAIQVTRSTDSTTADIGFNALGNLDVTALLNFVGAGTGTVSKWYDQSGNTRDVTQATVANQPVIVNAGTLVVNENGAPALQFDGSNDILTRNDAFLYAAGTCTLFYGGSATPATDGRIIQEGSSTSNNPVYGILQTSSSSANNNKTANFFRNDANAAVVAAGGASQIQTWETGKSHIVTVVDTGNTLKHFCDGVVGYNLTTYTRSTTTLDRFAIGGIMRAAASNWMPALISEIIAFPRVLNLRDRLFVQERMTNYVLKMPVYPVDVVGSSVAAWGLRKANSGYNGNCIDVRRSSDNTVQAIGFDGLGNLDQSALLAFVGSGSGFVSRWYDQSGNTRDLIQNSAGLQGRIVNAGSIVLENGRPIIEFLDPGDRMQTADFTAFTSGYTLSVVARPIDSNLNALVSKHNTANTVAAPFEVVSSAGATAHVTGNGTNSTTYNIGNPILPGLGLCVNQFGADTTSRYCRQHGIDSMTNTPATAYFGDGGKGISVGSRADGSTGGAVRISEIVCFDSWVGRTTANLIYKSQQKAYGIPDPTVYVCDGDSLTYGYLSSSTGSSVGTIVANGNSTTSYPYYFMRSLSGVYYVWNDGFPGDTIIAMINKANSTSVNSASGGGGIFISRPDFGPNAILIYMGGTNDLGQQGAAGESQAYTQLKNYLTLAKSSGVFKEINVCLLTPRNDNSQGGNMTDILFDWNDNFVKSGFNNGAGELATTYGVNRIIDPRLSPVFANAAATANTTYFNADLLHFTDAGYAAFAALVKAAVVPA